MKKRLLMLTLIGALGCSALTACGKGSEPSPAKEEKEKPARKAAAKKVEEKPAVSNVAAGTSLGDLDVLADLKAKMEQGE